MKELNRNEQISTISDVEISNENTGLTPIQEKAISLLISGKNITDVSNEINIDRGTLYNWFQKPTVKAYYNMLCLEVKENVQNGLLGLYKEAIQTIESSLKSDNESVKLKAAFWLIERLEDKKIEETDPRIIIRKMCSSLSMEWDLTTFDEVKYKNLCKENGLNP
jgi:hypothetical protein